MKYNVTGDNLQIVTCELDPNERVYAEAGAMVYMSGNMATTRWMVSRVRKTGTRRVDSQYHR